MAASSVVESSPAQDEKAPTGLEGVSKVFVDLSDLLEKNKSAFPESIVSEVAALITQGTAHVLAETKTKQSKRGKKNATAKDKQQRAAAAAPVTTPAPNANSPTPESRQRTRRRAAKEPVRPWKALMDARFAEAGFAPYAGDIGREAGGMIYHVYPPGAMPPATAPAQSRYQPMMRPGNFSKAEMNSRVRVVRKVRDAEIKEKQQAAVRAELRGAQTVEELEKLSAKAASMGMEHEAKSAETKIDKLRRTAAGAAPSSSAGLVTSTTAASRSSGSTDGGAALSGDSAGSASAATAASTQAVRPATATASCAAPVEPAASTSRAARDGAPSASAPRPKTTASPAPSTPDVAGTGEAPTAGAPSAGATPSPAPCTPAADPSQSARDRTTETREAARRAAGFSNY